MVTGSGGGIGKGFALVFRASAGSIGRVSLINPPQSISKEGRWSQAELSAAVPNELTQDLENPAPPSDNPVWRWML